MFKRTQTGPADLKVILLMISCPVSEVYIVGLNVNMHTDLAHYSVGKLGSSTAHGLKEKLKSDTIGASLYLEMGCCPGQ